MSLSEAIEQINQASRHLEAARKTLSEAPTPPPYTPAVGDVFSVALYPGRDRQYFLAHKVDKKPRMYGPCVCAKHVDGPTSELNLAMNSEIGRTVLFERRATVAEMIAHGLKEKDVAPRVEPDTIIGIKPWMLADDSPMVARIYGTQCVYVTRGILWSVTIDRGSGLTNESAQCHDKEQAMRVAEGFMGCGPLVWRRAF